MKQSVMKRQRSVFTSWRRRFSRAAILVVGAGLCLLSVRSLQPATAGETLSTRPIAQAEAAGLPRIGMSDSVMFFEVRKYGPLPEAQTFVLYNAYEVGILDWYLVGDRAWLAASPDRGVRNEAEIRVWVASTEMTLGPHSGHVLILSSNAVNSPETVTVFVDVLCPIELTGDVNQDGNLSQSDIVYLVNNLLRAGPAPRPVREAGDVNCDGTLALSDVIFLVNHVLRAGPSPCNACIFF